jgi:hypothetical protein
MVYPLLVGAVITTKEKARPDAGAGSVDAKPASADRKYVVPDSAAVMTFVDVTVSTSAVPVTVPVTLPTKPLVDVTGPEKVVELI